MREAHEVLILDAVLPARLREQNQLLQRVSADRFRRIRGILELLEALRLQTVMAVEVLVQPPQALVQPPQALPEDLDAGPVRDQ